MSDVGVYALMHWPKGLLYVGSSRVLSKRRKRWLEALSFIEDGVRPEKVTPFFYSLARDLRAADWEFRVLLEVGDDVSSDELRRFEYGFVWCFLRLSKDRLLNSRCSGMAGERRGYIPGREPDGHVGRFSGTRFRRF